jgi:two-component system chemotaxis response regulator CheY
VTHKSKLTKLSKNGDMNATESLALIAELGLGEKASEKEAFKSWLLNAKRGDGWAMLNVSKLLKDGVGTNKDEDQAETWRDKAAELGYVDEKTARKNFKKKYAPIVKPKILVVDDSKTIRMTMRNELERLGCEVFEAVNGDKGLYEFNKVPHIDLIFLDVNMPVMNGIEMLQHLIRTERGRAVPVIILSTERNPKLILTAKQMGIKGWIVKPAQPGNIKMLIDKIILNKDDGKPA